jgi:hypothetical protein
MAEYRFSDAAAAYKWLCNRRRMNWADKQVHEYTGGITVDVRAAAEAEVREIFDPPRLVANG